MRPSSPSHPRWPRQGGAKLGSRPAVGSPPLGGLRQLLEEHQRAPQAAEVPMAVQAETREREARVSQDQGPKGALQTRQRGQRRTQSCKA